MEPLNPSNTAAVDAPNIPWVHSPLFPDEIAQAKVSDEWKRLALQYHQSGFTVLENFIPAELIDRVVSHYPWMFDPTTRFEARPGRPLVIHNDPKRRQDVWVVNEAVRQLACLPKLLELLQFFYRRRPIPFQTLNFIVGSEQPAHSDSIHFHSQPALYMCGVWVALEDVTADNGPLFYYPGSHLLPVVTLDHLGLRPARSDVAAGENYTYYEKYLQRIIHAQKLKEARLLVKKGTALIWAANLLHGGTAIRAPGATRMSQVSHYFFDNCAYYAPIVSETALGQFRLRGVHDLVTDAPIPHKLNGVLAKRIPVDDRLEWLTYPS